MIKCDKCKKLKVKDGMFYCDKYKQSFPSGYAMRSFQIMYCENPFVFLIKSLNKYRLGNKKRQT